MFAGVVAVVAVVVAQNIEELGAEGKLRWKADKQVDSPWNRSKDVRVGEMQHWWTHCGLSCRRGLSGVCIAGDAHRPSVEEGVAAE